MELIPSPSKETSWKRNVLVSSPDIKCILKAFEIKLESAIVEVGKANINHFSVCTAKVDWKVKNKDCKYGAK